MINLFRKVVKNEDFLSLSFEDLSKLIASNDIIAFEEKVSKLQLLIDVWKINLTKKV